MKIFSITMVKNEADVIESFVRYHARLLDGMVILDNKSTDRTLKILQSLVDEGLPLHIVEDTTISFDQPLKTTNLLYRTLQDFSPDLVLPMDADEFLTSTLRGQSPRVVLERLDSGHIYHLGMRTYLPHPTDDYTELFIPRRLNYVRFGRRDYLHKVMVTRVIADQYTPRISMGNHGLAPGDSGKPLPPSMNAQGLRLSHYPHRSVGQVKSKVMVGWINDLCRESRKAGESRHWQRAFSKLKETGDLHLEDIREMARRSGYWFIRRAPMDLSWTGPVALKYTSTADVNPLHNFLTYCENLAQEVVRLKLRVAELEAQQAVGRAGEDGGIV